MWYHTSMSMSDQVRKALLDSGISRYRVHKDLGISQAQLSRFVNEKGGMSMELIDQLADYLNLEVRAKDSRPATKKRGK
jgi:plasmid maintenance system antidote protein VapI